MCGKELEDIIDVCPECGYEREINPLENSPFYKQLKDQMKDENGDLSFRIASESNYSYECFKKNLKSMSAICVVGIIMIIIGIFSAFFSTPEQMTLESETLFEYAGRLAFVFLTIPGIFILIYGIVAKFKLKSLLKNGIVLKNVSYKIIKETENTQFIEIEYNDIQGRKLVFSGKLSSSFTIPQHLCDVIYNQNNPKKYKIEYDIK